MHCPRCNFRVEWTYVANDSPYTQMKEHLEQAHPEEKQETLFGKCFTA